MTSSAHLTKMRVGLTEQDEDSVDELGEILSGLRESPKRISPKYFYDKRGSKLFDQICNLAEYYPTRTELAIMQGCAGEIADLIGPKASLIEFGSGSSLKIRLLLEHIPDLAAYVPVDISLDHLVSAASKIASDFPDIEVLPVAADFTHPFDLPTPKVMPVRNVVYFPGSTIGNFSPTTSLDLLRVMHHEAGESGGLLIGIDLQKDIDVLERAYNDAAGITAAFNINVLRHLNTEFGSDFDLEGFRHLAQYNDDKGRIEMYLVSQSNQTVSIDGHTFAIEKGEKILTEHSHKYTIESFARLAASAQFKLEKWWTDDNHWFAVCYLTRQ